MDGQEPAQIVDLIFRATRLMMERSRPWPSPLTAAHGIALYHVAEHEGVTTAELARSLKMTKQSASELVGGLVEAGAVERAPHPRDGRAQILRLTELGQRQLAEGRRRWLELEDEWVALVGADRVDVVREVLQTYLDTQPVRTA